MIFISLIDLIRNLQSEVVRNLAKIEKNHNFPSHGVLRITSSDEQSHAHAHVRTILEPPPWVGQSSACFRRGITNSRQPCAVAVWVKHRSHQDESQSDDWLHGISSLFTTP